MQNWTLNDCTEQQLKAHQYFDLTGIDTLPNQLQSIFKRCACIKGNLVDVKLKEKTKTTLFETFKSVLRTTNIKE